MKSMNCIECLQKHLAAALSYSKEIVNGHGRGADPDHRIDLLGELTNAEHHAEHIDRMAAIDLKNLRRALAARGYSPTPADMDVIRAIWAKFEGSGAKPCAPCGKKKISKQGTVDVLIPLNGKGSGHNNLELRYALRSIEQNLKGYRNIIVVSGNAPEWLTGVEILTVEDDQDRKQKNLSKAILAGAQASNAEHVLYWTDDEILLQELEALKIPMFTNNRNLLDYEDTGKRIWNRSLRYTGEVLKSQGKRTLNCDTHTPYPIDRKKLLDLYLIYSDAINAGLGVVINTLYQNHYAVPLLDMDTHKATFENKNVDLKRIDGKMFLGYNDTGFESGIAAYLADRFPDRSQYEKGDDQ